jgi:hypothetical protein
MKRRYRDLAERTLAKGSLLSKLERVGTSTLEQGSGQLPSHRGTRIALKRKDLLNTRSSVRNDLRFGGPSLSLCDVSDANCFGITPNRGQIDPGLAHLQGNRFSCGVIDRKILKDRLSGRDVF